MPGFQGRNGLVGPVVDDDGVAFDVAEAFGKRIDGGIKDLLRISLHDGPGNHVGPAVLPGQDDVVLG